MRRERSANFESRLELVFPLYPAGEQDAGILVDHAAGHLAAKTRQEGRAESNSRMRALCRGEQPARPAAIDECLTRPGGVVPNRAELWDSGSSPG